MKDVVKSAIILGLLALSQVASAASPSDGLWFQSDNPALWCSVSSGDYPGYGPQKFVFCALGEGSHFYAGNIPDVLPLTRRSATSGAPLVVMTLGTVSVSACSWQVVWGVGPQVSTMLRRPCNSVFVKPTTDR
jgi:hypothetical protein